MENIDCHLPHGEPFLSKYRLQHGDISLGYGEKGQLAEARAVEKNFLEYLFQKEKIETEEYHSLKTFRAWQISYRSSQSKVITSRYGDTAKGEPNEDVRYLQVIKQITKSELDAVENLFEQKPKSIPYQNAVYKLCKIIVDIEKEMT